MNAGAVSKALVYPLPELAHLARTFVGANGEETLNREAAVGGRQRGPPSPMVHGIMPGKLTADHESGLVRMRARGQPDRFKIMREEIAATARELRDAPGQAVLGT